MNAPHDEVLRRLNRAGFNQVGAILSAGVRGEGFVGDCGPRFAELLLGYQAAGVATEMPVRPLLHPDLRGGARDFRFDLGLWSGEDSGDWQDRGHLQVILFAHGTRWYADVDEHAPVDLVGAIGHAIEVMK